MVEHGFDYLPINEITARMLGFQSAFTWAGQETQICLRGHPSEQRLSREEVSRLAPLRATGRRLANESIVNLLEGDDTGYELSGCFQDTGSPR